MMLIRDLPADSTIRHGKALIVIRKLFLFQRRGIKMNLKEKSNNICA
jgi:hypothetical protein